MTAARFMHLAPVMKRTRKELRQCDVGLCSKALENGLRDEIL
jgi:hypothetical protein